MAEFGVSQSVVAAPIYNITPLGLLDLEHTRNDGDNSSTAYALNEAGQVIGTSIRYNGGSTDLGLSAWLHNGATTINIGLTGVEHTTSNGYKYSFPYRKNEAGQVAGYSGRFNGGNVGLGQSVWLYNGTTTIDIGLTDAEHTRSTGYKFSSLVYTQLNEAGQVIGTSDRFNSGGPGSNLGKSAWLYNGTTTINIGLTGSEHTRSDGYKYSEYATDYFSELNEAGQVAGYSRRYNGSADWGQSAWLYDGTTTVDIGQTGSEHTRNDGYRFSSALQPNEAGQVIGFSDRYNGGSTNLGRSAWLYNGATTINIGLTGSEHTRNDGYKYSDYRIANLQLNDAGKAIGYSYRYSGGSQRGQSAWFYDGNTTIDIGLTGPEHTRNDGYKYSTAHRLNEAGQVIGSSDRYVGGNSLLGHDSWFYDPVLDQTFSLSVSTRSDGYAYSSVQYLGQNGLAVGYYSRFDAQDHFLGNFAFYFTIADGLRDLGLLVDGGLAANGWEFLGSANYANDLRQIVGSGQLTSQSEGGMAYLLTPVPEPAALVLLGCGLMALPRRNRRYVWPS
jgi:hypothetical protein